MRIGITGAGGFLGRAVVRYLHTTYPRHDLFQINSRREVDLTDYDAVERWVDTINPGLVFHLAANPLVKLAEDDPHGLRVLDANLLGTWNLVRSLGWQQGKVVLASSATVYGDQEESLTTKNRCHPTSVYGVSKLGAEAIVREVEEYLIVRLVALVGRGAGHGLLPDLIHKLRSDSPTLELLGEPPGSRKPFLHVNDAARGIVELGLAGHTGVHNLSTFDNWNVEQVADLVMDRTGIHKPVTWLGGKSTWKGDNPQVHVLSTPYYHRLYPDCWSALIQAIEDILRSE